MFRLVSAPPKPDHKFVLGQIVLVRVARHQLKLRARLCRFSDRPLACSSANSNLSDLPPKHSSRQNASRYFFIPAAIVGSTPTKGSIRLSSFFPRFDWDLTPYLDPSTTNFPSRVKEFLDPLLAVALTDPHPPFDAFNGSFRRA